MVKSYGSHEAQAVRLSNATAVVHGRSTEGERIVHKFGHNASVGSGGYEPITDLGVYRTPQVSGATALRIKAGGDANDSAAGTGARAVTLVGLDATGREIVDTVATAGASASAASTKTFLRLCCAYVSASGGYATVTGGSHAAGITIENAAGTEDWAYIGVNGFPHGQTEIAAYTVPLGYTAVVYDVQIQTDANKPVDVMMFHRPNILETAAPYTAMRVVSEYDGVAGAMAIEYKYPLGPFPALTDIGFMGVVDSSPAEVSVQYTVGLIKN